MLFPHPIGASAVWQTRVKRYNPQYVTNREKAGNSLMSSQPTDEAIASEEQRLYESASLRDDLNDEEAQTLLTWGQEQVRRIAAEAPDDFEQQMRFLRQLIKSINRFVGQREFQDSREGEDKYMKKIMLWLPKLGWEDVSREQLYQALPDDKADMAGNLQAILRVLSPPNITTDDGQAAIAAFSEGQADNPAEDTEQVRRLEPPDTPAQEPDTPDVSSDESDSHSDDDDNDDDSGWFPF
jgi:hypothetical protein